MPYIRQVPKNPISEWLDNKFLDWQKQEGGRKTLTEFAQYLGVDRGVLNNWVNRGSKPEGDNLKIVAIKLGMEIYDLLEIERPDFRLLVINAEWEHISDDAKKEIAAIVDRAMGRGDSESSKRRLAKTERN